MANWNNPTVTSSYTNFVTEVKDRDVDAATMVKTGTNIPTNFKAWDSGNNKFQNWNGASWDDLVLAIAGGGTGASTAANARTNLGLGSMATQNSNSVSITGGSISGITVDASAITTGTLALLRGGTGASLSLGANGTVMMSNGSAVVFSSGANIANLNASNLTSGTIDTARMPSTLTTNTINATAHLQIGGVDIVTIPSGMIALFDAGCPSGWARFSALDGLFPRGASSYGGSGGSGTTDAGGGHSHTANASSEDIGTGNSFELGGFSVTTVGSNPHTHGINVDAVGDHTHTFTPPYLDMVYCKKT